MFALAQGKAFDKAMSGLKSSLQKSEPSVTQWGEFLRLLVQLSPENLSCDGELRGQKLIQKKRRLDVQWKALEQDVGRKVTEDEVWAANLPPRPAAHSQRIEKRRSR